MRRTIITLDSKDGKYIPVLVVMEELCPDMQDYGAPPINKRPNSYDKDKKGGTGDGTVPVFVLVILLSKIRWNFALLMKLKREYQYHTKRATAPIERFVSFRGFVMRKWKNERNKKNDRKIEKGFEEVTRNLTGYDFSRKR